jgi:UDP-galactopyranose mutase
MDSKNPLEEYWIASVRETLYSKIVKSYTEKMWQIKSCTELDTFKWSPKGVQIKEIGRAA